MKHTRLIMAFVAFATLTMIGCKTDEKETIKNLVGTEWQGTYTAEQDAEGQHYVFSTNYDLSFTTKTEGNLYIDIEYIVDGDGPYPYGSGELPLTYTFNGENGKLTMFNVNTQQEFTEMFEYDKAANTITLYDSPAVVTMTEVK